MVLAKAALIRSKTMAGTSGELAVSTGDSTGGSFSGQVAIHSGNSAGGRAGSVVLAVGAGDSGSAGNVAIAAGDTAAEAASGGSTLVAAGAVRMAVQSTRAGQSSVSRGGTVLFTAGKGQSGGNVQINAGSNTASESGHGGDSGIRCRCRCLLVDQCRCTAARELHASGNVVVGSADGGAASSSGSVSLVTGTASSGSSGVLSLATGAALAGAAIHAPGGCH